MMQVLGPDDFEGRTLTGWHHHLTMVAMAQAFLATLRRPRGRKGGPPPSPEAAADEIHRRVVCRIGERAPAAEDPQVREERVSRLWALHDAPLEIHDGRVTVPEWRPRDPGATSHAQRKKESPEVMLHRRPGTREVPTARSAERERADHTYGQE